MAKYLFQISYNGTPFSGLQKQVDNPNTIQEHLENALQNTIGNYQGKTTLASRTDKGVHANEQFILFNLENEYEIELLKTTRDFLANDIQVHDIKLMAESFNLNDSIKSKTYQYKISFAPSITQQDDVYYHHTCIDPKKFIENLSLFLGEHEFRDFCIPGGRNPTTKRKIDKISLSQDGEIYCLQISGAGFLKYMVRFIVGSLVLLAENKLNVSDIKESLAGKRSLKQNYKAAARGLTLLKIHQH